MPVCIICGDVFEGVKQRHVCSDACRRERKRRYDRERLDRMKAHPTLTPTLTERRCYGCKRTLPAMAFGRNRSVPGGLQTCCKRCRSAYQRRPEQQLKDAARKAVWNVRRRERLVARYKETFHATRDARILRMKSHYEANKDRHNAWMRAHYEANRERIGAANRARAELRKGLVRRTCVCGRGFWGPAQGNAQWWCSRTCFLLTTRQVTRKLVEALYKAR